MPNLTTNFSFNKPLVNNATDADLRGAQLNTNWDSVDTLLYQRTPPGIVMPYTAVSAPTGWLLCDGSAVSRATYADLYAITGDKFGEGDGSTTFNVPDVQGRFMRFWDNGAGRDPDAGSRTAMNTGGATGDAIGSIQGDATALPTTDFTTDSQGSHAHTLKGGTGSPSNSGPVTNGAPTDSSPTNNKASAMESAGAHTHTVTGGGDDETRPTNAYFNAIIKT